MNNFISNLLNFSYTDKYFNIHHKDLHKRNRKQYSSTLIKHHTNNIITLTKDKKNIETQIVTNQNAFFKSKKIIHDLEKERLNFVFSSYSLSPFDKIKAENEYDVTMKKIKHTNESVLTLINGALDYKAEYEKNINNISNSCNLIRFYKKFAQ